MVNRLRVDEGHSVLEPCAGDGEFVDELLLAMPEVSIDAYELNEDAVEALTSKYKARPNVRVVGGDFIDLTEQSLFQAPRKYARIIGNPPYGAWQDQTRRAELKRRFPGFNVRETYGLFLKRCIDLLEEGGRLVFIMPDTYLNLRLHEPLRRILMDSTAVEEIALFPSRFFPGISFGYANLSVITLRKQRPPEGHEIKIVSGFESPEQLTEHGAGHALGLSTVSTELITVKSIRSRNRSEIMLPKCKAIARCLEQGEACIGDIAQVVTGFYSGNDAKHLRRDNENSRYAKKYQPVDESQIFQGEYTDEIRLEGIKPPGCFIPIVKGGNRSYLKPTEWYMDWSQEAVHGYRVANRRKARYQNAEFYFRNGLAVPMVSSRRVTASLLEGRLFDQSIVGVFPHDEKYLGYLLAFFNTELCTRLLRSINPTANSSANYVKQIPFVEPSAKQLRHVMSLVGKLLEILGRQGDIAELPEQIESEFCEIYGIGNVEWLSGAKE